MLVAKVSPDITPLLSGSDMFLDSLEKAFLEFIRNGAMNHVLGVAPFAFTHFSRAVTLIESLLCKFLYIGCLILMIYLVPYRSGLSHCAMSNVVRVQGRHFDQKYNSAVSLAENDYVVEEAVSNRILVHVSSMKRLQT